MSSNSQRVGWVSVILPWHLRSRLQASSRSLSAANLQISQVQPSIQATPDRLAFIGNHASPRKLHLTVASPFCPAQRLPEETWIECPLMLIAHVPVSLSAPHHGVLVHLAISASPLMKVIENLKNKLSALQKNQFTTLTRSQIAITRAGQIIHFEKLYCLQFAFSPLCSFYKAKPYFLAQFNMSCLVSLKIWILKFHTAIFF